ncbi:Ferric reduction oxidase 4 [Raphanus sativus]|nr:Ferric reduction oxidase 4 [Raphanus sativus]
MVTGIVMWVTSLPYFRRNKFEIFFYIHHLCGLYIVFYVLHVGDSWFCMILPNIFLFFIDRYLRFLQSTKRSRLVFARNLPSDNLELTFSKTPGLQYTPTSILFLDVPSISKFQWHPFTITSNSNLEKDTLSVVIRRQGSWTQKLYTHIASSLDSLEISTEGPYGPNSLDLRHDSLILVSGGSGISPFISIIRELIFQAQNHSTKIPDVLLVCAFKYYHDLAFLDLIFPPDISVSDISRLNLRIEAYITQEDKKPEAANDYRLLQTKWFKPQPLDSPISPVLGPNNLLWLGVVILSSFVMFLLLIVIVTRYYIYPVDLNTGMIYNFSYRSLWDMFLGCVCIFVASSIVFLWHKKVSKEENKESSEQVRSVALQMSTSSPSSWFYGSERELESAPYQSIVQATSVQFGAKPNLKKILVDAEGSKDVGVMVCGPRNMRHDVARICSSGLAKNLRFEAISFDW